MVAPASNLPSAVQAVIDALADGPVKCVVIGGVGSGKSSVISTLRTTLQHANIPVSTAISQTTPPAGSAVVIDDAHLLGRTHIQLLTDWASLPDVTVIVATEQRDNDADLRSLLTTIERDRPRIVLGPLPVDDALADITAGISFLVDAAAKNSPQGVFYALIDRLRRLDETDAAALLIATLGTNLGATDIAAALGVSQDRGVELIDRARGTGLVEPSHTTQFTASVHAAVAQIVGNARHQDIETALLRSQLEMATLTSELAVRLAEHGMRNEQLAEALRQQALTSRSDPRLLRAAVTSGADELKAELADALALSGQLSAAASLTDELLGSTNPAEQAAAVRIAASVAAAEGNAVQAGELFSWLGPYPDTAISTAATIVLTSIGDIAGARDALATRDPAPPTAAARAARSLADGLLLTLDAGYPAAAVKLGQAISVEPPRSHAMPDSVAALVTLAAIHGGDPIRARNVITRTVQEPTAPLYEQRHQLMFAWIKMQDGQLTAATADISQLTLADLGRRDALWLAALRTAIARRTGDVGAIQKHWFAAVDVLAEYSIDIFSLLPVGELWMSAARIGQQSRLTAVVDQAFALLRALGNPIAWSVPLHWAGVHVGILTNNPAAVAPHGQALAAAAAHSPFAKALATAGRSWLRGLAGQVNPDDVTVAARGLAEFGLTADATRLAGQAALQASDPKISGLMLQIARELKLANPDVAESLAEPGPKGSTSTGGRTPRSALSDRERQVAELLLLGMPYRDIGDQLFISAKTVEHHVARIRRRLGAESRSEMLSMLRAILSPQDSELAGQ